MTSAPLVFASALVAVLLWSWIGWIVLRRVSLGADMRVCAAPALGWALQTVTALLLSSAVGLSVWTVLGSAAALAALSRLVPPADDTASSPVRLPWWALAAAVFVALGPIVGLLPKLYPEGVALAPPIYDHSKIALIDEMIRGGAPPANPFYGQGGQPGSIAYYYLWHFGAAELAILTGASGWEADIAATWFTAFASLTLVSGLAFRLSGGRVAGIGFVLVAVCGDSLRPVLAALVGQPAFDAAIAPGGLSNWLVQTSWSPHHVASATTVVLALLLMARMRQQAAIGQVVVLGLLAAAGFQSSVWVGGASFALAAVAMAAVLLVSGETGGRMRFVGALASGAVLALLLAAPLLAEQVQSAGSRGGGLPIAIEAFPVLGPMVPAVVRRVLDPPAYWLVLLFVDFPVLALAAVMAGVACLRRDGPPVPSSSAALMAAAFGSLCCAWVLASRAGENNDLGWRGILPALLIATAMAGAYAAHLLDRRRWPAFSVVTIALLLTLPAGIGFVRANLRGDLTAEGSLFRAAPAMWAAVRRHTPPDERVASNPMLGRTLTPWPVNVSWALLADRRSCFAGNELAIAFAPLSAEARRSASDLFERVFAGRGTAEDVAALLDDFGCRVVLVTPEDGAWQRDPFAASGRVRLAEDNPASDGWRIYVAR
ncbi:hypothetical protein [Marinivivus vitaminiproducens]|uniref:hypothetical protein n=1 Tax=Marinivivus vitaminiproducens TaxID=3035935 RepID=UPI00279CD91A|nr:hypothetical protein P4R82_12365 [Geminicoccaceae bacterium SCSIO 64248]